MILVIGGFASGKRTYVRQCLGYCDQDMADQTIDDRPVVINVQNLGTRDEEALSRLVDSLCEKEVLVACEIGLGIIPLEKKDREARECAGRLVNRLALRADRVIRMVCGIPMVIKG